MIFRIFGQAVAVVLLVAIVGVFVDYEVVDVAVAHITGGLQELVDIGKRLGSGQTGRQIGDLTRWVTR